MALPKLNQKYGLELQFLTNHIGHFILVTGLLESLTDDGRLVVVSSAAHKMAEKVGIVFDNLSGELGYSPWGAYAQSKLANLLFVKRLAKKLEGTHRTANAVHPGVIRTNLGRHMSPVINAVFALFGPLLLKSIPQGAATQCYLATHPDAASVSGQYYADCNSTRPIPKAEDDALAAKLWEVSEDIVRGFENTPPAEG